MGSRSSSSCFLFGRCRSVGHSLSLRGRRRAAHDESVERGVQSVERLGRVRPKTVRASEIALPIVPTGTIRITLLGEFIVKTLR